MRIDISGILYLPCVIYTFLVWGFWWGLVSILFPVFPFIDIVKWAITYAPWLK